MKRIFSNTILATTILGMTTVPVFAAVGGPSHRIIIQGSVASYHDEVFGGAKIILAQSVDEGVGDDEFDEGGFGGGEEGPESEGFGFDDDQSNESDERFAARRTSGANGIIRRLDYGEGYCRLLDSTAKIDCLGALYEEIASGLPDDGEAGVVKQALEDAAEKLDAIVRNNRDTTQNLTKPIVRRGASSQTASRPLRKISPARLPAANRQAEAVVTELSTVLLRSAGSTQRSNLYYTRIAEAVDSNKVLLRS